MKKPASEVAGLEILQEVYGKMEFKDSEQFGIRLEIGAELELFDIISGNVYLVFAYDSGYWGILGPIYLEGGGSCANQHT